MNRLIDTFLALCAIVGAWEIGKWLGDAWLGDATLDILDTAEANEKREAQRARERLSQAFDPLIMRARRNGSVLPWLTDWRPYRDKSGAVVCVNCAQGEDRHEKVTLHRRICPRPFSYSDVARP